MISLPTNHPDIASSYEIIGKFYDDKGECDKAFEFLQKGLEIYLISLRPNHPDIATLFNKTGVVYNSQGNVKNPMNLQKSV